MRLYTVSPYRPRSYTDISIFCKEIIVPNNITMIIDIRSNIKKGLDLSKDYALGEIKKYGCKYLYIGDYPKDDEVAKEKKKTNTKIDALTESEIKNNEKAMWVIRTILSSCKKFNTCILGGGINPNRDNRALISYLVKEESKNQKEETLYIMHIGG